MRVDNIQRLSTHKLKRYFPNYLEHKYLIKAIKYSAEKYSSGVLLDIGCGNKPYKELFNNKIDSYIGCDIVQSSGNMVDILCEANNIPVEADSYTTVFSTQTIEHVADCYGLVNEAYRVLKPGGYFILSGPMYWPLHEEPYDFYRFTKHGFQYMLDKAGFEVVEIIPNGGKWALMGQVIFHTFPKWILLPKFIKIGVNSLFSFLDDRYFDPINTMNYVVIGRKK